MKKATSDTKDLEEEEEEEEDWELVCGDGYDDKDVGKVLVPDGVFDFGYFIYPSTPIQLEKNDPERQDPVVVVPVLDIKVPHVIPQTLLENPKEKKQFVDMKMEHLVKYSDDRGMMPEAEVVVETDDHIDMGMKNNCLVKKNSGVTIWRWKLNGIGVLCSIGVAAAATMCIFIIGSRKGHKSYKPNREFRFQIITDDKRIKQVVHHATRLNQAISAVAGVPITKAHITLGGYYDGSFETMPDFSC